MLLRVVAKKWPITIIKIPMEFVGDNTARLRIYVSDKKKQKQKQKDKFVYDNCDHLINFFEMNFQCNRY